MPRFQHLMIYCFGQHPRLSASKIEFTNRSLNDSNDKMDKLLDSIFFRTFLIFSRLSHEFYSKNACFIAYLSRFLNIQGENQSIAEFKSSQRIRIIKISFSIQVNGVMFA